MSAPITLTLRERTDADALAARARYAAVCRQPAEWWHPVEDDATARHLMLDFCDPVTGRYGQAIGRWGIGGEWMQAPIGARPVLLCYDPPRGRRKRKAQERRHGYVLRVERAVQP